MRINLIMMGVKLIRTCYINILIKKKSIHPNTLITSKKKKNLSRVIIVKRLKIQHHH